MFPGRICFSSRGTDKGGPIKDSYLVSSHGAVLFHIAVNPDCTITDIAEAVTLTRRTLWSLIGDLRGAGMLHIRKDWRRHHYTVNPDAPCPASQRQRLFASPAPEPYHLPANRLISQASRPVAPHPAEPATCSLFSPRTSGSVWHFWGIRDNMRRYGPSAEGGGLIWNMGQRGRLRLQGSDFL
jgi:hypothetical protein